MKPEIPVGLTSNLKDATALIEAKLAGGTATEYLKAVVANGNASADEAENMGIPIVTPDPMGMQFFGGITTAAQTDRLVKGLIGEESLAVVAGPAGSGKTFYALHMAICAAMEREFFGRKTLRCGVLYVGAEGQAGLRKRIMAWKKHFPADDGEVPFALYPAPIDLVTDPKGIEGVLIRLELLKRLWPKIEHWLVVADTLARCFGSGDESATKDMNTFVTRCDSIRNRGKTAVLIVHHFGKDESKGMRGSVALKAAADTVIEITGTSGVRTAKVEKQKDGETGDPFTFSLVPVETGRDDEGQPITSCIVEPATAPAKADGGQKLTANQATMLTVLADAGTGGLNVEEWNEQARDAGIGNRRAATHYDARTALLGKKLVYEFNGRWYVRS